MNMHSQDALRQNRSRRVSAERGALTATIRGLWPYLWPSDRADLRMRIVWATLILLGLGWNFGFVGASAMVLECHRPEEKARVQSFNDFAVFGTMAVGSFLSGGLLSSFGWNTVLWLSFAPLLIAVLALVAGRHIAMQRG